MMIEETFPGLWNGKFHLKELPGGSVDKTEGTCICCCTELYFFQSTRSLKYFQAKHVFADMLALRHDEDVSHDQSQLNIMIRIKQDMPRASSLRLCQSSIKPVPEMFDRLTDLIRLQ